jgi:hypothetical protein
MTYLMASLRGSTLRCGRLTLLRSDVNRDHSQHLGYIKLMAVDAKRPPALSLSIQQAGKGFHVAHRVVDRIVLVRGHTKSLPALAVAEISHAAGVEVTDASAGMAAWVAAVCAFC